MKPPHTKYIATADRVRELLHLSNRVIAERLGYRLKYIQDVRRRHSGPSRPERPGEWTDERVERLKKDWEAGYSASQCAARLGGFGHCPDGGRSAVIGKVHRLGLAGRNTISRKRHPPRKRVLSREMLKPAPKPLSPAAAVIKAIKRDGLPLPPPQETDVARVSFAALNEDGHRHCRWPVWSEDTPLPDVPGFCGLRPELGLPYCKAHSARAYNATNPGQPFKLRIREVA
jgi:GcrA cell cycle regulator